MVGKRCIHIRISIMYEKCYDSSEMVSQTEKDYFGYNLCFVEGFN